MPRKPCYWTRKLELELVEFVHQREYIWRPFGNSNHHIQQKYKAYAEFAARLGRGFTARSVRDRWVNIRSTFNHNLRRVDKSKESAKSVADIYVPCWPLWKPLQFLKEISKKEVKPLQFLKEISKKEVFSDNYHDVSGAFIELSNNLDVKEELPSEIDDRIINIRQRGQRTDRPRRKSKVIKKAKKNMKCEEVIDELLHALKPLVSNTSVDQPYWFFAKHVVERLNSMRPLDATYAAHDIYELLEEKQHDIETT